MAFHLFEDVWETSTTTGTGDYTLGGAVTGWRAFSSQYADADSCRYSAYDGTNFEHGRGVYNSGANSLTRSFVVRSTNANAAVNWGVGTRQITVAPCGFDFENLLAVGNGFVRKTASAAAGTLATWTVDAAGQMLATATNDSASAGNVGEILSSNVAAGSAVAVTTATSRDVTSLSLTAGDWDVWGNVAFLAANTTVLSQMIAWTSQTSGTLPTYPNAGALTALVTSTTAFPTTGSTQVLPAGMQRISLSGTTTVYLSCFAAFTTSTLTAYGFLGARRRR